MLEDSNTSNKKHKILTFEVMETQYEKTVELNEVF